MWPNNALPYRRKTIIQKAWCHRNDKDESLIWDGPLTTDLDKEFSNWISLTPHISSIKHVRYLFEELDTPPKLENMYLRVICDAGETAFEIAVYLRYNIGTD